MNRGQNTNALFSLK